MAPLAAAAFVLAAPLAGAQTPADCAALADDSQRLGCYDKLFRGPAPAPSTEAPLAAPAGPLPSPRPTAQSARTEALGDGLMARKALTVAWELTPETKRGTFAVRTFQPNFFLPAHYTSHVNDRPFSPTHGLADTGRDYRHTEAKFQVSLRTKAIEGLLLPGADLWLAYTQRSLWQLWTPSESSPFRSTDYQPEAIYVLPVPARFSQLPGGWHWRMLQLGFAHQSNGQSDPLSRSWNRVYATAALEHGEVGLQVTLNRRTRETGTDDNPGITRYIGNTELAAFWLPGRATASLTWRLHPLRLDRGSLQFDWTYPLDEEQPDGLRWYVQVFSGYGETLLDYNHRQTSIGLGLTLFQF
jgi:phospholipase A1